MRNGTLKGIVWVICALLVCACGKAEVSPEAAAHLEEYEQLIEEFEPKFERARNDTYEFSKLAESYRQQARSWLDEWATVAPDLSDSEGQTIRAAIDKLNARATRMLTGV